ncbi:unnamed protein product, partial [Oncorhynchus mykiss]
SLLTTQSLSPHNPSSSLLTTPFYNLLSVVMFPQGCVSVSTSMLSGLVSTLALFGFSVLQHDNAGDKSMLVGAPWDGPSNTRRGDVYKCIVGEERSSNCTKTNLGESTLQNVSRNLKNSHLGMTLSPDSPDGFLVRSLSHWLTG